MKLIKEKYVDKDIKVASNIKRIMFKSDGIPMDTGTIEVRYKEKTYTITITPISEGFYLRREYTPMIKNNKRKEGYLMVEVFVAICISLIVMSTVNLMLNESISLVEQTDNRIELMEQSNEIQN